MTSDVGVSQGGGGVGVVGGRGSSKRYSRLGCRTSAAFAVVARSALSTRALGSLGSSVCQKSRGPVYG